MLTTSCRMQMVKIPKTYVHWDIDNPELSNFNTASILKVSQVAFGFTSQIIYPVLLGLYTYIFKIFMLQNRVLGK